MNIINKDKKYKWEFENLAGQTSEIATYPLMHISAAGVIDLSEPVNPAWAKLESPLPCFGEDEVENVEPAAPQAAGADAETAAE